MSVSITLNTTSISSFINPSHNCTAGCKKKSTERTACILCVAKKKRFHCSTFELTFSIQNFGNVSDVFRIDKSVSNFWLANCSLVTICLLLSKCQLKLLLKSETVLARLGVVLPEHVRCILKGRRPYQE